jgi:uncharacterized LabA/DUF88 family protein
MRDRVVSYIDGFNLYFGLRSFGWKRFYWKMTDVNIAVEMLVDAYNNTFDTALLISADSDLTAPLVAIRNLFPGKRVIVAFPPNVIPHS